MNATITRTAARIAATAAVSAVIALGGQAAHSAFDSAAHGSVIGHHAIAMADNASPNSDPWEG